MRKLAKYLVGYRKECVLGPLGKLCEATLELIVPLIVAVIIDRGIGEKSSSTIISMSLVLVLLGAVGLLFSVFAQYFSAKAAVGFITKVKLALFSHIQSLSYSDLDNIGTSTLITRMTTDASRVQTGLNLALRLLLRSPFVVFGAMIMAFTIDTTAGIAFAVTIPALAIVVFGIMLITTPLYRKVQSGLDRVLLRTRENLSGVRVIRAFGKEDEEYTAFRAEDEALTVSQERVGKISALMNPLTYIIINLGIVALIYIGALKVNVGTLTQGEVIALNGASLKNFTDQQIQQLLCDNFVIVDGGAVLELLRRGLGDEIGVKSAMLSPTGGDLQSYEQAVDGWVVDGITNYRASCLEKAGDYVKIEYSTPVQVYTNVFRSTREFYGIGATATSRVAVFPFVIRDAEAVTGGISGIPHYEQYHPLRRAFFYEVLKKWQNNYVQTHVCGLHAYTYQWKDGEAVMFVNGTVNAFDTLSFDTNIPFTHVYAVNRNGKLVKKRYQKEGSRVEVKLSLEYLSTVTLILK